ncbi:uncharacterized protein PHACADRAFT_103999, partial [Phanerochaete carnosa HHB-10118-sp]
QKHAAAEAESCTTRSKVAKTDAPANGKAAAKSAKRGSKALLGAAAFKAKALPTHVNLTHTPPVLVEDAKDVVQTDPGFIVQTSLAPTAFSTGSYSWKGTKRVTIELEKNETGGKEKEQVMMTFNATVIGSKNAVLLRAVAPSSRTRVRWRHDACARWTTPWQTQRLTCGPAWFRCSIC